jgi:hypothetical protein
LKWRVTRLEGKELHVGLHGLVAELPADQPLGVEDGVLGVGGQLVLGGVAHQPLAVGGEGDVAGGDPVALVVVDDLNTAVLEDADTREEKVSNDDFKMRGDLPRVCGAEIDPDDGAKVAFLLGLLLLGEDGAEQQEGRQQGEGAHPAEL